jgi:mono/diheme cytochrome c family protein
VPSVNADEPKAAVPDFARDVKPIFAAHCVKCHGPDKQRGGLRLDRKADALKGSDSGAVIVPGKPTESPLLQKVTAKDAKERMPPMGQALTPAQIRTLTAWIEAGAKWSADAEAADSHWAFQPVQRPKVPEIPNVQTPITNPIDRFIQAKLSDKGLSLAREADRRTLIRRLKFDLLGLSPTPEEVAEFLADKSPDAYEKLVEKYLASPHYGERWARHWLDVVRFAESHGFETNQPRPNAWPYRDWVIKSLNDDKPYDRFVREQLAGDTLGADAATGFIVGGAWDAVKSPDIVLTSQQRADELHDMVSTTGSAFLGLTVGCARCHSHKFDPVPQLDYYRFKAVFAGVHHGDRPLRSSDNALSQAERQQLRERLSLLERQLAALEPFADPAAVDVRRPPVNAKQNTERFAAVKARFVRFVIFETNNGSEPCIDELEVFTAGANSRNAAVGGKATSAGDYPGATNIHRLEFLNDGKHGNSRSWISNTPGRGRVEIELKEVAEIDRIVWARDREEKFADRLAIRYRIDASLDGATWAVVASSDDRVPFSSKVAAPVDPSAGLPFSGRLAWKLLSRSANDVRSRLGMIESRQMVYAGKLSSPEPTHRLHRGDPMQKRELVGPGVLSEIGSKFSIPENATDPQRREAFAKWVTDPANPLTSRVIVNRLWQYHFGTGIVDTPSDFGKNGGKPTHPELLDWLASELQNPSPIPSPKAGGGKDAAPPSLSGKGAGGLGSSEPWSLKHIHRLIVTSATYRQSSAANPDGIAKDAQSRLLWRYAPRRIEAETLRDSILQISGKLDTRMGGPGFDLFQPNGNYVKVYTPRTEFGPAEFRRMVYQQKPRMQLDDTFGVFDCPDAGQIAPRRNVSTTPLQALNLLNSTFTMQQAGFFAERVAKEAGRDVAAQVKHVFALTFQRLPTEREQTAAETLVQAHGLAALCRAVLNANEFVFVD